GRGSPGRDRGDPGSDPGYGTFRDRGTRRSGTGHQRALRAVEREGNRVEEHPEPDQREHQQPQPTGRERRRSGRRRPAWRRDDDPASGTDQREPVRPGLTVRLADTASVRTTAA